MDFLELWSLKLFVQTYITFLKGYDAGFPKKVQNFNKILLLKKKNSGRLAYTEGAAGDWVVNLFSPTDFDETIIFVLSKDQTIRKWSAFLGPVKNLILVTHLFTTILRFFFFSKHLIVFFCYVKTDQPSYVLRIL